MQIYGILEVNQKLPRPLFWRCDFHEFTAYPSKASIVSKALFLSSPHAQKVWGTQSVQKRDAYPRYNHVEILHMWDMYTTRNRLCMRCGFGNFDFNPENFTLKIHCFGWSMVHVPMPSHIPCQKTCFFQKHVNFFYRVGSFQQHHDVMIGCLFLRRCFLDSQQFFLSFLLDIFFWGGIPQNSLKEMIEFNKFWMSRLKWWKMQFQRWEYHSNPRLGKIFFLNML